MRELRRNRCLKSPLAIRNPRAGLGLMFVFALRKVRSIEINFTDTQIYVASHGKSHILQIEGTLGINSNAVLRKQFKGK